MYARQVGIALTFLYMALTVGIMMTPWRRVRVRRICSLLAAVVAGLAADAYAIDAINTGRSFSAVSAVGFAFVTILATLAWEVQARRSNALRIVVIIAIEG